MAQKCNLGTGKTSFAFKTFEYLWQVEKKAIKLENADCVSPKFVAFNAEWNLELTYNEESGQVGLHLTLDEEADSDYVEKARFKVVLKGNGKKDVLDRSWKIEEWQDFGDDSTQHGWDEWMTMDEINLKCFDHQKYIKILLELEVQGVVLNTFGPDDNLLTVDKTPLVADFSNLLKTELLYDITFTLEDCEIRAHRAILALRCPYFMSMFTQDFKEKNTSRVEITDIDRHTFNQILVYIYTNQLDFDAIKRLDKLFIAADKFGLEPLIAKLEERLEFQLTKRNCVDLLVLSDTCSRQELKQKVLQFMKHNMKGSPETNAWKNLVKENLQLAFEAMEFINQQ